MSINNTTQSNVFYPVANGAASSNPFVQIFEGRDPTSNDTQYPIQKQWLNTMTDDLWELKNFTTSSGIISANWIKIGGGAAILDVAVQAGTSPVVPNAGTITFNGATVAAGTVPVQTDGTGPNTMALQVQLSQAIASTNASNVGLAAFSNTDFSVDANGFVSLVGSADAIEKIDLQAGTTPVGATLGVLTFNGATVAAGSTPVQTFGTGASTMALQVQTSQAIASTDATKIGLSAFNSADFTVDANGFVGLVGGHGFSSINIQTFTSSGTYTPTAGMLYCIIQAVGGGGAGGGSNSSFNYTVGSGGGAGGYSYGVFSAGTIGVSQSVTIGAGGTGSSGAAGGAGTATSVGALITCNGGSGGGTTVSSAVLVVGGAGGTASGGSVNITGGTGGGANASSPISASGYGASSNFGSGGANAYAIQAGETYAGTAATGYGAGGSGGATTNDTNSAGGNGAPGIVIITEYI